MLWKYRLRLIRLFKIAITLGLLVAILLIWQQQRQVQRQELDRQALALTEQLLTQASFSAGVALQQDNDPLLQWVVQSLVADPRVLSASLFNYEGQQLAFAQRLFPDDQAPESTVIERALAHHRVLTTPVIVQEEPLGYLRVRVNQSRLFNGLRQLQRHHQQQQGLLLLLSGLVGWLLGRTLSAKRAGYSYRLRRARQFHRARRQRARHCAGD